MLLDAGLAELFGVETMRLKEAVRSNRTRFPADFMFELSAKEAGRLRSQIASSSWGGSRHAPFAFTEQGVAMLSSVLNSDRAIGVDIQIMRVFVKMRQWVANYAELLKKIETLEHEQARSHEDLSQIYPLLKEFAGTGSSPARAHWVSDFRAGDRWRFTGPIAKWILKRVIREGQTCWGSA